MRKKIPHLITIYFILMICVITFSDKIYGASPEKQFYQIKVYQLKNEEQVGRIDSFLKEAYLPALHKAGIDKVGVFKPIANDTATVKMIYVFIPFQSWNEFIKLADVLEKDETYKIAGKNYMEASYNNSPYIRMESILLEPFPQMPQFNAPHLKSPSVDRVYELRSYEGATEKLYNNKVQMFNEGGEIDLFSRLGFNAVFYAKVISGSHMPNLMYMTSFENMASRDAHWKTFGDDTQWKQLVAKPEYQNNVSHSDIILMHPAEYSDI